MIIICPHCKQEKERKLGYVNRAKKLGVPIYCSKLCSGLARKIERTDEEKKRIKSEYDKEYRGKNIESKKAKAKEYFKRTYDPIKAAEIRKKRMPKHVEYCRQPEYRKWKKEYDKTFRAKKVYGEFWESSIALNEIKNEIDNREIKLQQNLTNKTQKRKRQWKNSLQTI